MTEQTEQTPQAEQIEQADWWDDLAVAALLGTDRRPDRPTGGLPPELAAAAARLDGDPAGALLDAAALALAYRRAGVLAERVSSAPERAPAEDRRRPSPRAAAWLERALAGDVALTRFWCETAAAAGLVAPDAQLPALLDRAGYDVTLRAAILPVLGERGRWLAGLRVEWAPIAAELDLIPPSDPAQPADLAHSADPTRPSDPTQESDPAQLSDPAQPVLSGAELAARLAVRLPSLGPADVPTVVRWLAVLPPPWPEPVAAEVLGWLVDVIPGLSPLGDAVRPLLALITTRFPLTDRGAAVAEAARSLLDDHWRFRLGAVARDLHDRAQIHEELQ